MALKYQKQKNLVRSPDEYTRYYGNFRGVDFSSDHTEVNEQRLAYAINMYKDYRTGEGNAIETVPGFRRRFEAPRDIEPQGQPIIDKIHGIHEFEYVNSSGKRDKDLIVHAGEYLYHWDNYPKSVNVILQSTTLIPEDNLNVIIGFECHSIESVIVAGATYRSDYTFNRDTGILTLGSFFEQYQGFSITINYYEKVMVRRTDAIPNKSGAVELMSDSESKSFTFNNRLYIMDGTHYYVYYRKDDSDEDTFVIENVSDSSNTYLPTTYRNLALGDIAPEKVKDFEYEQKNLLNSRFKHTYIPSKDSEGNWIAEYPLYTSNEDYSSLSVIVNEVEYTKKASESALSDDKDFTIVDGVIKFKKAPQIPSNKPESYAAVEVIYTKDYTKLTADCGKIEKCTVFATFDKRVFMTGNPDYPNSIWYCGINNVTGYEDATYFGELDTMIDGVENAPITGLIPVADTLAALKNHTRQDGSVFFHTRAETGKSVIPVIYPSQQGLSGIGCLGACINFLDDPVFISRLGVEAIGQLSVRLERAVEHRSSLIDAKLVNLQNLDKAKFTEWDGYLVLLVDGKIFLADSRQKYAHETGVAQYEWYYLEGIGIYEDQHQEYYYAHNMYSYIPEKITKDGVEYEVALATNIYNSDNMTSENLLYTPVKINEYELLGDVFEEVYTESGTMYSANFVIKYTWDGESYEDGNRVLVKKAILCENYGSMTGGDFHPATNVINIDENIFFGTDNGIICSFNFDIRNSDGTISPKYYTFDNRTIYCGIATKMDNCGIPHLTKSTIKKSTVVKTKSMIASAAKVRVRTNSKGYTNVARVNSTVFSFDDLDFSDFSFVSTEQTIFAIKEKEKHWVEKQHWIYSDEYQRPFSVHYLAFRYKVSGRIKN